MKFKFIIEDTEDKTEDMVWSNDLCLVVEEMNELLKEKGHMEDNYTITFLSDEESATLSYAY